MAEFGENLKRVREEKGITQQTLADYLYVTRQAVSRWEGGSRYPDLMTAKKMAQYLEVSLDELLSDDDMRLYVEKNAILDSPVSKRAQILLISLAFMCSLVLSVIYMCHYFIHDMYVLASGNQMLKNVLLAFILGYGVFTALYDKMNPKLTAWIAAIYLGTAIMEGMIGMVRVQTGVEAVILIGATVLNIFYLIICVRFFGSKKQISPMPLYITAGVYAVIGIVSGFVGLIRAQDIPSEFVRDIVMLNVFQFIEGMLMMALFVIMARALDRKRKLVAR